MELDTKKILSLKQKDIKELGLKSARASAKRTTEIELEEELHSYNSDILRSGNDKIAIIQGKDESGNKIKVYYYNNQYGGIDRQQRNYNSNGDIIQVKRNAVLEKNIPFSVDEVKFAYKYDKTGKKISALSQDEISGVTYYRYDKDGNMKMSISKECVIQKFYDDNNNVYEICDGYFKPTKNGYMYKLFNSAWDLEPKSMKRTIRGNISEAKKNQILKEFNLGKKEKVLQTLKNIEFAAASVSGKNIDEKQINLFVENFKNPEIHKASQTEETPVEGAATTDQAMVEYNGNVFFKVRNSLKTFFRFK